MRTSKSLREMLFTQLEGLQDGSVDLKTARAFTKTASQIVYSSRVDIENKRIEMQLAKTMSRPKKNLDGKTVAVPSLEL